MVKFFLKDGIWGILQSGEMAKEMCGRLLLLFTLPLRYRMGFSVTRHDCGRDIFC